MSQNKKPGSGRPDPRDPHKKITGRNAAPNMAFRREASRKRASSDKPSGEERKASSKNKAREDEIRKKRIKEEKKIARELSKKEKKASAKQSSAEEDTSKTPEAAPEKKEVRFEEQRGFRIGGRVVLCLVFVMLSAFMGYLIKKQYDIQVLNYEDYSKQASNMHWKRIEDVPTRGDILDCNGNLLASTTYEYTIGMTPSDVLKSQKTRKNGLTKEDIASAFAEYVGADHDKMLEWLDDEEAPYIQIIKKVNLEQMKALSAYISENSIGGVKIDTVPKRYYTYDNLAAQVIGFADQSDNSLIGQVGIEAYYNSDLTGTKGYTYAEVDNYNRSVLPYSAPTTIEAVDGYNVQLTLDMNIQRIAEEACRDAYDQYNPKEGVTCIVMNPYTGEIKAMVSMPDFNLNTARSMPYGISQEKWDAMSSEDRVQHLMSNAWRNRCISDTYEPGSTMKALTTAIALEEGKTYEDEYFSDAPIKITTVDTISCWREKTEEGNHGEETLREAFERSCNPIFVQLAGRIGIERYYDYIRNCGFYDTTGVDLPAEGKGIFHAKPTDVDLATLSFGESSTVTPLQLITAYCSLVNGGSLMRPHIASRLVDKDGNIIREYSAEKIRTLFSEGTAKRVRSLLEDVVNVGTGSAGYVPGYYVAGKTSTSTIETGEEAGMHVISFCCHAPSYDPQISVLLIINKPDESEGDVGSSVAAKVASRIVEGTLEYMGIQRKLSAKEYENMMLQFHVPDVTGKTFAEAKKILMEEGFDAVDGLGTMTGSSIVGTMYYGGVESVSKNSQIILYEGEVSESEMNTTVIPNFEGMNIVEAQRMAKQYGLNLVFEGNPSGSVVAQTPQTTIGMPDVTPTPTPGPGEEDGTESGTGETNETEEGDPSEETTAEPGESTSYDPGEEGYSGETTASGEDGETNQTEPGEGSGESEGTTETTVPPRKRVPYGTVIYLTLE